MENDAQIVRYTAEELDEMIRRGEDQTNWARLDAMTDEELEASIDPEEEGEFDWSTIYVGLPPAVADQLSVVGIDKEIVDWFMAQGGDYRSRINTVLRRHVEAEKRRQQDQAREREAAAPR